MIREANGTILIAAIDLVRFLTQIAERVVESLLVILFAVGGDPDHRRHRGEASWN